MLVISHLFQTASDRISLKVDCDKVAVMVYLDAWPLAGHFSDNLLVCIPGRTQHIVFDADDEIGMHDFNEVLVVSSLADTLPTYAAD